MRLLCTLATAAALLTLAASAAGETPRQVGGMTFTTTTPGSSTGTALHVEFQNPSDPTAKPYAVETMVIHGPAGTVVDTTAAPQCHASDAEIYVEGPAACPPDSQIGSGMAVSDSGPGALGGRYSRTPLTHFNNQDEVVGIGVNESVPASAAHIT